MRVFVVLGEDAVLKSTFNLTKSYHRVQVRFSGACRGMRGVHVNEVSLFGPVLFGRTIYTEQRLSSAIEQKGITRTFFYSDSEPASRLPSSLS